MKLPTRSRTVSTPGEHEIPGAAVRVHDVPCRKRRRVGHAVAVAVAALAASAAALAHHGIGRFDRSQEIEFTGIITGMDFVNPHSYLHFDMDTADDGTLAMRCEMRAATLLRRSGWTEEMFIIGADATVYGFRHRDDPASCYLEDITIGNESGFNRNDQFEHASTADAPGRPMRLPSGELTMADVPSSGWGPRPVTLTARGQAEADAFVMWSTEDNPRLRCEPTSLLMSSSPRKNAETELFRARFDPDAV